MKYRHALDYVESLITKNARHNQAKEIKKALFING